MKNSIKSMFFATIIVITGNWAYAQPAVVPQDKPVAVQETKKEIKVIKKTGTKHVKVNSAKVELPKTNEPGTAPVVMGN